MAEPTPCPTPGEIAAVCRQIQAEWSAEEEQRRRVLDFQPQPWTVPRATSHSRSTPVERMPA